METPTQLLHRLTSYSGWDEDHAWDPPVDDPRVARGFEPNDVDRMPWFHLRHDPAPARVELPRELPPTTGPATAVLAGTAQVAAQPLDLARLGRLLHLSAGVVRTSPRRWGTHLFRAAGSAGGRFPLELYVAVPDGGSLPPGVHWYHPVDHALVTVGPPPAGGAPTLVVTGVPWRTGWRYRERGFRHVYWDAGTMLAQTLAAAASGGTPPRLFTRFPDAAVTALVGADGVHEWPVAVVALGPGAPALTPTGPAVPGRVDADPVEFPLVTAAQHAGDGDALADPWPDGDPVAPLAGTRPVEDVVLARGSGRRLDPTGVLPAGLLRGSLAAALRGVDVPHVVAVMGVEGLAPGLYRWPDLDTPTRAAPAADLRAEMFRFCIDQGLGRDACFDVVSATDVSTLDDRGYRDAQLAAGLVEGRLHLLAYAAGAAATGMTFLDPLAEALTGLPDALLVTCVGVPEYRSTPGGAPGAPNQVMPMQPRD